MHLPRARALHYLEHYCIILVQTLKHLIPGKQCGTLRYSIKVIICQVKVNKTNSADSGNAGKFSVHEKEGEPGMQSQVTNVTPYAKVGRVAFQALQFDVDGRYGAKAFKSV